jgi:hypothetical protein
MEGFKAHIHCLQASDRRHSLPSCTLDTSTQRDSWRQAAPIIGLNAVIPFFIICYFTMAQNLVKYGDQSRSNLARYLGIFVKARMCVARAALKKEMGDNF